MKPKANFRRRPKWQPLTIRCFRCGVTRPVRDSGVCYSCTLVARNRAADAAARRPEPASPRPRPEPTAALPGSEEKIRVLMERVRLGQELWHEGDARG